MVASSLLGSLLRAEGTWRGDRCLPAQPTASSSLDSLCTGSWGCALCFPTSGFFQAALPLRVELDSKNEGCSERGAPGSSSEQGRSSSLRLQQPPRILTADPDGGERKGPTVLWEPHQEDCQAAGPGVTGAVGGGTDKCWLVEVNQARAGSPAAALLGEGRPHLLRTPCSKEGEPLVSASKWQHSCSCPGHPPVPPACTGGLPAGLLRKLTAMGSLLASQSRPAAPWCSAKGLLASPPPLWGQHHQPHGSCGMETQRSLVSSTHLLASAEGTHWGTKGRGQDWDFFVINGKEQVYE